MAQLVKDHPAASMILVFLWILGIAAGMVLVSQMYQLLELDYACVVSESLGESLGLSLFGLVAFSLVQLLLLLLSALGGIWILGIPFGYLSLVLEGFLMGASWYAIGHQRGVLGGIIATAVAALPFLPAAGCLAELCLRSGLAWKERFRAYCRKEHPVGICEAFLLTVRNTGGRFLIFSFTGALISCVLFHWLFP